MVCLVFSCKTMQWISVLGEVWCSEYHIMITFCMGCSSFEIQNKIQVFQKLLYWDYSYIWGKHHLLQELNVQSMYKWQWLLTIGKQYWHEKCFNLPQIKRKLSLFSTCVSLCWQIDFCYILSIRLLGCHVSEYVCSIQELVTKLFTLWNVYSPSFCTRNTIQSCSYCRSR